MAKITHLEELSRQVTITVDTRALLTWLQFGTTDPPVADSLTLRQFRKKGRLKIVRKDPRTVAESSSRHIT